MDGVDFVGVGFLGVKDNDVFDVVFVCGGVNFNGVVMFGDGDIVVDVEGNVFVVGVNIVLIKMDVVIIFDGGMVSGCEVVILVEDDVVIIVVVCIYLFDFFIEDEDMLELNVFEVEV